MPSEIGELQTLGQIARQLVEFLGSLHLERGDIGKYVVYTKYPHRLMALCAWSEVPKAFAGRGRELGGWHQVTAADIKELPAED